MIKTKVTVIDKKLYPELQQQYSADSHKGACPCYNVGDEYIFSSDEKHDDVWRLGLNTLVKTTADPDFVAGGPKIPHCTELWDAVSRYIFASVKDRSSLRCWMKDKNALIVCCSDGTRPVIFKIERMEDEK